MKGPLAAALLAMVLAAPSLGGGLVGDDYIHRALLLRIGDWTRFAHPVLDLFNFLPPSGPVREYLDDRGFLPWWSDPTMSAAHFRPLTALTHRLDYRLWPDHIWLHHAHNLLWLGVGVALVACLYRDLHGPSATALLAGGLFAVEDAHATPAAWLANRNALVALVLGVLVIRAHVRWRRGGGGAWLVASLAALIPGLLASEAMIGALAYVVAWEMTMESRPWRGRLAALLPYAAIVAAWRVACVASGYTARGLDLYVDPGTQPLRFALALAERAPLLWSGQWLNGPHDLWILVPRPRLPLLTLGTVAASALVAWLLWRVLRTRPLARFWTLGAGLALVPCAAVFPTDRLFLFAGIGVFATFALLAEEEGLWPRTAGRPRRPRRLLAVVLLLSHGALAPIMLVVRTALWPRVGHAWQSAAIFSPTDAAVAGQTFVYVTGNEFSTAYCIVVRETEGRAAAPRRVIQLASMLTDNAVFREDDRTLVVTPDDGYLAHTLDRQLANPARRFAAGERIRMPDYTVDIRAVTADGRPAQAAFRFDRPLEDPSLRWLVWEGRRLVPFRMPGVGETVRTTALR